MSAPTLLFGHPMPMVTSLRWSARHPLPDRGAGPTFTAVTSKKTGQRQLSAMPPSYFFHRPFTAGFRRIFVATRVSGKGSFDSGPKGHLAGAPYLPSRTRAAALVGGAHTAWLSDRRCRAGILCEDRDIAVGRPYRKSARLFLSHRLVGGHHRSAARAGRLGRIAERNRTAQHRIRRSSPRCPGGTTRGAAPRVRSDSAIAAQMPRGLYFAQGAGIVPARNRATAQLVREHCRKTCQSRHPPSD